MKDHCLINGNIQKRTFAITKRQNQQQHLPRKGNPSYKVLFNIHQSKFVKGVENTLES